MALCLRAAVGRVALVMSPPLPALNLHGDWLAVLIQEVQLFAMTAGLFAPFSLKTKHTWTVFGLDIKR